MSWNPVAWLRHRHSFVRAVDKSQFTARPGNHREKIKLTIDILENRELLSVYYVATNGVDSPGRGTSTSDPFATVNYALGYQNPGSNYVRSGDTLYLRGGTYNENIGRAASGGFTLPYFASGTSWSTATTVASYPGETAILQPVGTATVMGFFVSDGDVPELNFSYIVFDRPIVDGSYLARFPDPYTPGGFCSDNMIGFYGGVSQSRVRHIRMKDCEVRNNVAIPGVTAGGLGIHADTFGCEFINVRVYNMGGPVTNGHYHGYYMTGSYNLIDGGEIFNNGGEGIQVQYSLPNEQNLDSHHNTIRNAKIHDNGSANGSGIVFSYSHDNVAYNNLIWNHPNTAGIAVAWQSNSNSIYNNTCYGNGYGVQVVYSSNTIVRNNVLSGNGMPIDDGGSGSTWTADHNVGIDYGNATFLSTNPANANFLKLASGSPGIDQGVAISSSIMPAVDRIAVVRPQNGLWDIGAYEYSTGGPQPPVAPSNLSASAVSSSQINLTWSDNSGNETGFEVDCATNSSFTTGLTTYTTSANATSYSKTGLSASTTYWFRVRATIGGTNDSSNSNTANATTQAGGPVTKLVQSVTLTTTRNDWNGFVGLQFTTGASGPIVTQLGRWIVSGNNQIHELRLANTSGAVLGSVNLNTAGATAGQFAYATLPSSVNLAANTSYYLGSYETVGGDSWYEGDTTVTPTSLVSSINDAAYTTGFTGGWNLSGWGANHSYVPVDLSTASQGGSLPTGWTDADIGSPGVAGSASTTSAGNITQGTWTVKGSGDNVDSGGIDQFNFASEPYVGDSIIVAKMTSLTAGASGIMFRDGLASNAKFA